MTREEIGRQLMRRLADDFGITDIAPETPLFTSGLLDSVHLLELVIALDEDFAVVVPALDVSLERFDSVARLTAYIATALGLPA